MTTLFLHALQQLGKGGNGVVNLVQCKETGEVFASKSILKVRIWACCFPQLPANARRTASGAPA